MFGSQNNNRRRPPAGAGGVARPAGTAAGAVPNSAAQNSAAAAALVASDLFAKHPEMSVSQGITVRVHRGTKSVCLCGDSILVNRGESGNTSVTQCLIFYLELTFHHLRVVQ